jgi:hypothetical protein
MCFIKNATAYVMLQKQQPRFATSTAQPLAGIQNELAL